MAVSLVASLALYLRSRKPQSVEAGIREFQRELRALAPTGTARRARRPG
ncbi:MAG: hypothetical protein ACRD0D_15415 [Acidimicrobiales bacterium]